MQLASYLEWGPLMWMMLLHLHVNPKSDYDDDDVGIHKMLDKIANREVPDQSNLIWIFPVYLGLFGRQLVFEILEHL